MLHTTALYVEIISCIISLLFSTLLLPRKFLHTFRCLSGSSFCRIQVCTKVLVFEQFFNLLTNEYSFFSTWPHLFWEIFALHSQTLRFLYVLLAQIFLSNCAWYAAEVKIHFLFCSGAVPRLAVPLTAELTVLPCSPISIPKMFRSAYIFHQCSSEHNSLQQNLKVHVHFFHVNCMSQLDRRELISIVE